MKNILVPIGSHENAINTLQYAIDFAEQVEATIYLVHVFSSSKVTGSFVKIDKLLKNESKQILKEHLLQVNKKNVTILPKSLKGHNVIDSLKELTHLLEIDLVITSTKNDLMDDSVFLGKITGSLIKDTETPILIIPSSAKFRPISKILMTIKSGSIKKVNTLDLLILIQKKFNSTINLLQVKTPKLDAKDLELNEHLKSITSKLISTRNATVYQGVLEFLHEENPDMLCVIRRKRGFFKKLWQDDRVKKVDFESIIPLLVLKGKS